MSAAANTSGTEGTKSTTSRSLPSGSHKQLIADPWKQQESPLEVHAKNGKALDGNAAQQHGGRSASNTIDNQKLTFASMGDVSSTKVISDGREGAPLPMELRKLLKEVAISGKSSLLSWDVLQSDDAQHSVAGIETPRSMTPLAPPAFNTSPPNLSNVSATKPVPFRISLQASHQHRLVPMRPATLSSTGQSSFASLAHAQNVSGGKKKYRNGVYHHMHHIHRSHGGSGTTTGTITTTATSVSARKRPFVATIRSASSISSTPTTPASSIGGNSEPEEVTSQYDWDSEGTSATSNSELSMGHRDGYPVVKKMRGAAALNKVQSQQLKSSSTPDPTSKSPGPPFESLRQAFRLALEIVLDHWFQTRGGYKMSPSERQRYSIISSAAGKPNPDQRLATLLSSRTPAEKSFIQAEASEELFRLRKSRLIALLDPADEDQSEESQSAVGRTSPMEEPPFTIQRVAEVLLEPERFFTQTHKLCNALEKLLLVSSSMNAFGGSNGGNNSQSRQEEIEIAALADEKGRLEAEFRNQRRIRGRFSSVVEDDLRFNASLDSEKKLSRHPGSAHLTGEKHSALGGMSAHSEASPSGPSEMGARESLATMLDTGIDVRASAVETVVEVRAITRSPPPPGLSSPPLALTSAGPIGLLRQSVDGDYAVGRAASPILLGQSTASPTGSPTMVPRHSATNVQLLQLHHAAALAGVSQHDLKIQNHASVSSASAALEGSPLINSGVSTSKDLDVFETRSSASSDLDSESDDVSFDDSASDRSDGSDSGASQQLLQTHQHPQQQFSLHSEPVAARTIFARSLQNNHHQPHRWSGMIGGSLQQLQPQQEQGPPPRSSSGGSNSFIS